MNHYYDVINQLLPANKKNYCHIFYFIEVKYKAVAYPEGNGEIHKLIMWN